MGKLEATDRTCHRCGEPGAIKNEKYCYECRKGVIHEMKESGYLSDKPPQSIFNDERGRKNLKSWKDLGGAAEMNSYGDDW